MFFRVILLTILLCVSGVIVAWRIFGLNYKNIEPILNKPFSFAALGDLGSSVSTYSVLKKISDSNTNFTIALGDLSYGNSSEVKGWCDSVKQQVGDKYPFEIVAGNHDTSIDKGNILEYRKCLPNRIESIVGDYGSEYYFDYNNLARVILVSPGIYSNSDPYTKGTSHYNWLAESIDGARKANIKWVILGMHKNCITIGEKTCEIGEDLFNLAIAKKVDLILQGHEHNYARSKQLSLSANCPSVAINTVNSSCIVGEGISLIKNRGSVVIINGAGGLSLRDINLSDPEIGYFEKWNGSNVGKSYGFSKFDISDNTLKGEFMAVDGTFVDKFTITSR